MEIREVGDVEVMSEVFASFAAAMGAGLMMVYGLLVLLFGSFLQPITILISLRCRSAARSSRCSSPTRRSRCQW